MALRREVRGVPLVRGSRHSWWLRSAAVMAVVLACGVTIGAPGLVGPGGAAGQARLAVRAGEPQVCSGCVPPLTYMGGPVMGTTSAGVTVTPIFWQPSGGQFAFPAGYEAIIENYITNVAAADGGTGNVYSVATEYYQNIGGTKTAISYDIHAGSPLIDTDSFPGNGCTPDSGYSACITDAQLQKELASITSSQNLPSDLADFYPVFFPPGVETQDSDGTTSANNYCGYHGAFGPASSPTVYADLPIVPGGACDAGQSPNGNLDADGMVSTLSHELNESITDPLPKIAWNDQAGHEIADMCADTYGPPLGSTDPSNPSSTEYNQVINGGRYYTQTEFSDYAYSTYGLGKGCAQSEALAQHPSSSSAAHASLVASAFLDATPNTLPADGSTTSSVAVSVSDKNNYAVQGDHIHLSVGVLSGTGVCGKLSNTDGTSDDNGYVHVTYTASTDNVSCWVYAVEADGGQSAEGVIYQGNTQKEAATFNASFPTVLYAGGSATTFTIKAANPSSQAMPNARVDFAIFPGTSTSKAVDASQVHLSYSTTGPNGTFTQVHLSGSTGGGNVIQGYLGNQRGVTLAANSTQTYTFHVSLASSVPVSGKAALIAFEAYLDQINTGSGSGATLADTYATNISVMAAPQSNTLEIVLIAVAAVVVVVGAIVGFLFWRRRKSHPRHAAPGAATT